MRQRIVLAAAFGAAAPRAALIEQHRVETFGIEQPPMIGLASAAGSAMQIDGGNAAFAADAFDMDVVTIANRQQFGCQRCERVGALRNRFAGVGISGVDLTFAIHLAANSQSECQIPSSTEIYNELVVL